MMDPSPAVEEWTEEDFAEWRKVDRWLADRRVTVIELEQAPRWTPTGEAPPLN